MSILNGSSKYILGALLCLSLISITGMVINGAIINVDEAPQITVGGKGNVVTVPATGVEGFPVDLFCADPLTTVQDFEAPDASGITYQLLRVRDGKTETVVIVMGANGDTRVATHYYDSLVGQQSEPAFVNEKARECIEDKAE